MKKRLRDRKFFPYILASLILTGILFLFENVCGVAIRLIPLSMVGEERSYLTLGGNYYSHYYPMHYEWEQETPKEHEEISFNLPFFLIMYAARYIIVIPVTKLFVVTD